MTDFTFTDTIESTAASIEDLSEDLEAHLEDILDVEASAYIGAVDTGPEYSPQLEAKIEFEDFETELEDRLGGSVAASSPKVTIEADGDPE